MELSTKSFVRAKTPDSGPGAERITAPAHQVAPVSRSTSLRFIWSLMSAFADAVEPAMSRLIRHQRWAAVELENGSFEFYRVSSNQAYAVGSDGEIDDRTRRQLSAKNADVELRLSREQTTTISIKVPSTGLEYVEQIIGNRLDRLTPWRPDKVLYGYFVGTKRSDDDQLDVTLTATSREIAAKSIERLAKFGVSPSRVGSAAEPLEQPLAIDLLRGQNDTSRNALRRMTAICAVVFLGLSVIGYAGSSVILYEGNQQAVRLDAQLAKARQRLVAGIGDSAERQLDLKWIESRTVGNTRLDLINRLAASIPDNTFLDEIDIEPGSVRIAGTSTEASALIAILQSVAGLSDAHFSAPVTREADGRDRFDITAALQTTSGAAQ